MNTIPPNDFSYYEMLDALVQEQPADALEPEIGGQFAAIGIVKGKTFNPDARMRKILTDAIAMATPPRARSVFTPAPVGGLRLLQPDLEMAEPALRQRLRFHAAAARDHQGGRASHFPIPAPARSTRAPPSSTSPPASRPAMVMRLPDIGSQYLFGILDATAIRSMAPRPIR